MGSRSRNLSTPSDRLHLVVKCASRRAVLYQLLNSSTPWTRQLILALTFTNLPAGVLWLGQLFPTIKQARDHFLLSEINLMKGLEKYSKPSPLQLSPRCTSMSVLEGEKWTGENFRWHELSIKASDEGLSS